MFQNDGRRKLRIFYIFLHFFPILKWNRMHYISLRLKDERLRMKKISYATLAGSDGGITVLKYKHWLYTAGGDTLCVYDVRDAESPRLIRRMHGFGDGRQLAESNGRLYLTARCFGLWILSLENPASPKILCRFDTVELATGIAATGNYVFVTHRIFGIEILDCSDPAHPKHCSMIRTQEAQSAVFQNGLLYVGEWGTGQLLVLDVSDPYRPVVRSVSDLGGYGDGLAVSETLCCAATGLNRKGTVTTSLGGDGHGLDLFRLSPDGKPEHLSRLDFPRLKVKTNDFWTVRLAGNTAFVADTHNGMFQVDVSDPENPVCTGRLELPGVSRMDDQGGKRVLISVPDCVGGIAPGDRVVYVIGQKTGLHVAKISEADDGAQAHSAPFDFRTGSGCAESFVVPSGFRACGLGGQVRRVFPEEARSRLFAACSHAGLKILKMTSAGAECVYTHPVRCSYDVAVRDGLVYSAEGMDGVAVYSAKDDSLHELGRFIPRGRILQLLRLSGDGRFAICGCRDGILRFLDVSDPAHIRPVRRHLHGGLLYGDTMPESDLHGLFPVIWPYAGLAWYDLSGEKPEIVRNDRSTHPVGQCEGITCWNGCFLITTLKKTFRLLDPSDCGRTWSEIPSACSGVPSVDGDIAAFSHRRNGDVAVYRMDRKNRSAKQIVSRSLQGLSGTPDRVVFYHGRMVIPCGYQGLLIENA